MDIRRRFGLNEDTSALRTSIGRGCLAATGCPPAPLPGESGEAWEAVCVARNELDPYDSDERSSTGNFPSAEREA
jgi:hypothetical protein